MKTIRLSERNWRPDDATLVHTGDYRVPQDLPEALAERALAEGVAVLVEEAALAGAPEPAPAPVASPAPAEAPTSQLEQEPAAAPAPAPTPRKSAGKTATKG